MVFYKNILIFVLMSVTLPAFALVRYATIAPLQINLDLSFPDTMDNEVYVEYQYFNATQLLSWKGSQRFANHNGNQSMSLPRDISSNLIKLYLRPGGIPSVLCVPANGQNPLITPNITTVELVGRMENNQYYCELYYRN
jgi:hypothetical protein